MSYVDQFGLTILSPEEFTEAINSLGESIKQYAEQYPEEYARHCANRERESEVERWGDSDDNDVGGLLSHA